MSLSTRRPLAAAASLTALGFVTLGLAPAHAAPACEDPVVGVLHTLHDTAGDPTGLVHDAEETYCRVAP